MIDIITGWDHALAVWAGQGLGRSLDPERAASLGFGENGELIATVVFNGFEWPSIEASIYSTSPRWATRRTLKAVFWYPFRQLQCRRCGATTAVDNADVRAFLERLGFQLEGIAREALPGGDAAIYGMLARECRWL